MKNVVANAVFVKDNKVLLEKRKKDEDNYAGLWSFPGGHREKTETIEEALHREMKEELKVTIVTHKAIGEFDDIDPTSKEPYYHHFFLCTKWIGEITETTEEEGIRWVELREIPKLGNVSKTTLNVLEKLKEEIK